MHIFRQSCDNSAKIFVDYYCRFAINWQLLRVVYTYTLVRCFAIYYRYVLQVLTMLIAISYHSLQSGKLCTIIHR